MAEQTAQDRGWGPGWPNCQEDKWVVVEAAGIRWRCHERIATLAVHIINDWDRNVEKLKEPGDELDDWSAVCRAIRKSDPPRPSNHSWGLAFDFNSLEHPLGKGNTFTAEQVKAIRAWQQRNPHWRWGGDFKRKDEMHVEYVGTPQDADAETRALEDDVTPEQEDAIAAKTAELVVEKMMPMMLRQAQFLAGKSNAVFNANTVDVAPPQH